jgi:threonine dehydrogenase-like Zn-dependent dehydrogenase
VKARVMYLTGPRRFEPGEEERTPGPGQVLVAVRACGVCMSEMERYLSGPESTPVVLGHEPAGEVVAVGEGVTRFRPGDRVTGLFGRAFASHVVVDAGRLWHIPEGIPYEHALGEPIKCVVTAARASSYEFGDTVVLIGCGFMGLMTLAAIAGRAAAQIIAIDLNAGRLALARELGATHTINAATDDPVTVVRELTGGRGAEVAIEATGQGKALELAAKVLRRGVRPKLVMVGYHNRPQMVDLTGFAHAGLIAINAHPSYSLDPAEDMRRGLEALARGIFPMQRLVTHRLPLERLADAFELARSQADGYIKAVIVPDGNA